MTQPTAQVIVSQAEFARLRGVSRATVTHWKRAGRLLLTDDGKVNVAASEELLSQRPETYRGGRIKPTDGRQSPARRSSGRRRSAADTFTQRLRTRCRQCSGVIRSLASRSIADGKLRVRYILATSFVRMDFVA